MIGHFYFVSALDSFGLAASKFVFVGTFYACTSKPSDCQYFGGYQIDKMDTRNLIELKKSDSVSGLWMKEGGSSRIKINPIDLFETYEEAEIHLNLVESGKCQPSVIEEF
jgi:hypothetical protein